MYDFHYQEPEPEPEPEPESVSEPSSTIDTSGPDKDCSDFSTRAEAQAFMDASRPSDPLID
ncbi:hypothetical protein D8M04_07935 [Oceanobacillus piezotolerans]|uniref:Uncharacterized protein n=2 Tax=Oceanobacillus piezotolerans TaxID=2448030 RepID=A0A498D8Q5_9BACI|nr:hypothetical protein D8M04_07935 [Oceanobacillus piezotolerans]